MASIEAMIKWMTDRKGKVVYSNARPWGGGNPPQYDCSSAVISALQAGGFVESNLNEGWTGSLHDSILPKIATKISRSECRKGDMFVAKYWDFYGHTGFFIDNNTIIHCNAGDMTINTTVADGRMGPDPIEYYRLNGVTEPPKDEKKGEITMQCLYAKGNAMYYFTGDKIKILTSPTQANILKIIYRDNNGKDMPVYDWSGTNPTAGFLEAALKNNLVG